MRQRHVNFLTELPQLPHLGFDLRIAPAVALGLQTLKDPFRGVALLFGHRLVLLKGLLDTLNVRTYLGLGARYTLPVTGGLGILQDLLQRPPVDAGLSQNLTLAYSLAQYPGTNLSPLSHVGIHPFSSRLRPI